MKYFKKMIGERLYLSPVNADDYEKYTKWANDPAVAIEWSLYCRGRSLVIAKERMLEREKKDTSFAVVRNDDVFIGLINIRDINYIDGTAIMGICIGDGENRSKGYGTEAVKLLLEFGFKTLGLRNICLHVNASNGAGLKSYKKVGFKEFARRTEARYIRGKYVDAVYMEILRRNFLKKEEE